MQFYYNLHKTNTELCAAIISKILKKMKRFVQLTVATEIGQAAKETRDHRSRLYNLSFSKYRNSKPPEFLVSLAKVLLFVDKSGCDYTLNRSWELSVNMSHRQAMNK